jgi:glutathione peroxidase
MVIRLFTSVVLAAFVLTACTKEATITPELTERWTATGVYNLQTETLEGEAAPLSAYAGKVSLVVNVASKCGLTPQYEGLQALHEELGPQGFTILAFPSNDFGGQEPGSPAEIRTFCTENYDISFPIFAKLQTKEGDGQSELYSLLGTKTGDLPGWNFGKYLIAADGTPLGFYSSRTSPADPDLRAAILAALEH